MHMHKNTTQQYPDIPVHKQTQYPDTERTQNSAHNYRTYSFDFYHLQQYIKKLYNTAIYKLYTFCSPHQ